MTATAWRWVRLLVGAAILVLLVVQLGSAPVVAGLHATSPVALAMAVLVTAATTWCCARRWSLVADRLGAEVPTAAYPAYYRSQLVNATLPGGVVGDVHRGLRHGLRAVVWERGLGQLVQVALTIAVLCLLPTPLRWTAAVLLLIALGVVAMVALLGRPLVRHLLAPAFLLRVALLSVLAAVGHLLVFVVAARAADPSLPLAELLPVGALVLLASAVPTNVAGWGPREGMAAWAFAATGLGAEVGLTVAVTYGVVSLVATLPAVLTWRVARG